MMVNLTNYPYPTYTPDKPIAITAASIVGISLIGWLVQTIQARFRPPRLSITVLIAHLLILTELILRAALPPDARKLRRPFTTSAILCAVGQRLTLVANNVFLTLLDESKPRRSRLILLLTLIGAFGSGIILGLSNRYSHSSEKLDLSFRLRQTAAAIILAMTILFYPLWFIIVSKASKAMTKEGIIVLVVSSFASLIVAIYLQVTSIPVYYVATSAEEFWFYDFQLAPLAIALFAWTIFHPKRSLASLPEPKENLMENVDTRL